MLRINKIKIPDTLWKRILKYYEDTYSGVIPPSYSMSDFAKHRLESSLVQIERLKRIGLSKKSVCLDAGCGIGTLVTAANLEGYNYFGYEIDPEAKEIAQEMLKANGISPSKIQSDPNIANFNNKKFDFMSSFETVEHVDNLDSYLNKLRKSIKNNGKIFIETPNYTIPYEPHFYVFLIPGPRILKWLICKIAGRTNKKFFDELRFVTHSSVESALTRQKFKFKNLGIVEWSQQLSSNDLYGRSVYVQLISKVIRTLRISWLLSMLAKNGLYTPLVYLATPNI